MPRRAAIFTQTDFDRAAKAAAKVGYAVEIRPGAMRLVPSVELPNNSPIGDEEVSAWDKVLK